MVRTVFSPEYCLQYLEQYATQETFVIGLILGQSTNARENVIHLARTPEEKGSENASENSYSLLDKPESVKTLLSVSEVWVADHAKHVTRMLPGGMFVQGIFITSGDDVFEDPNCFSKVKAILNHIYKALSANQFMYGNCVNNNERLILHMSTNTKVLTCKSLEVGVGSKSTVIKPVDWKFVPKTQQWQRLDCYYEFDEVYPVVVKKSGISVKQQFQAILESAHKTIDTSVMFIDGDLKDGSEVLEQLTKKKKSKSNTKSASNEPKTMLVSLFVPFENNLPETVEYLECDGSIHFSGVVSSSVFIHPKATVSEAIAAVKQDIVRSLASRFTMHCDALIDDNLLPEEKVCFNEPPRRVLVPVGGVFFCDYLFPGEAPAEALLSVRELLDLNITEADVLCDVETPAGKFFCDYLFPGEAPAEALLSVRELLDLNITEADVLCDVETPAGKFFCDYLFPGEAPAEALLSVRELLDLNITEADVLCDVETPAGKFFCDYLFPGEAPAEALLSVRELLDLNIAEADVLCDVETPAGKFFCDYLFPGEAPAEALLSVRELLDLNITEADVLCDVETPAVKFFCDYLFPGEAPAEALLSVRELLDLNITEADVLCDVESPASKFFCDYLFPGKAPAEALLSVRELLDLNITEADVLCDVETPADTSEFDALDRDTSSEELLATPQEANQFMYITGICFAMLVLVISIIVHYYDDILAVLSKIFLKT